MVLDWNEKTCGKYVQECRVCQQQKRSSLSPGGLLQLLPIPSQVLEDISNEFCAGSSPSQGKGHVVVAAKYAHFITNIPSLPCL